MNKNRRQIMNIFFGLTQIRINLLWFTFSFLSLTSPCLSQPTKKKSQKAYKCVTYVHNLSAGEKKLRDICFSVDLVEHYDYSKFDLNNATNKQADIWRFNTVIIDNTNLNKKSLEAAFFLYEENADIIQFHCKVESSDIKALIYNNNTKSWQILLYQNGVHKLLSRSPNYQFVDAFNAVKIFKNGFDY